MNLKYGFISRSDVLDQDSLLNRKIQEEFHKEILDAKDTLDTDSLIRRYRKLREAVYATFKKLDEFIFQVYLESIDLAIKGKNLQELIKSLQILELAQDIDSLEFPRKEEIQEYFLLYLLLSAQNLQEFFKFYLKFNSSNTFVLKVLKCTKDSTCIRDFFQIFRNESGNRRVFLEIKVNDIRQKYTNLIKKGFKQIDLEFLKGELAFNDDQELKEFLKSWPFTCTDSKVLFKA
jgi:hypothetical protein